METYLGLDVGEKRIGVAVSELGTMAMPLEVVTREGQEFDRIADLVREHQPAAVVAGMPYSLDGTIKPQAEKVQAFLQTLEQRIDVPIVTIDERLTTAQADRMLIAADRKTRQRRQVVDKVAASLILQAYLDRKAMESEERDGTS
jgi:putative holliday junction resolvase